MPLNLASPGIVVREVDLTIGRVDTASDKRGAIVAPFAKGPVDEPTIVESEQDLLDNFGEPYSTDKHFEHWMVASSFLAYGGSLSVVRADDAQFANGAVGTAATIKIKSLDHYNDLGYDGTPIAGKSIVARNPGSWSNGVKVAIIDAKVDQTLSGLDAASPAGKSAVAVGYGITQDMTGRVISGAGSTSAATGYLKGIVTEVDAANNKIGVKVLEHINSAGVSTTVDYTPQGIYSFNASGNVAIHTTGQAVAYASTSYTGREDWFGAQTITLSNSSVQWDQIADRPSTSTFAAARGVRFDEVHVVVYDDKGTITGNAGTVLEKHVGLSKLTDAEYSIGSPSYWRKFIANQSDYIFAGGSGEIGLTTTGYSSGYTLDTDGSWDQSVEQNQNGFFDAAGNHTLTLEGGKDYNGQVGIGNSGALEVSLAGLRSGYELYENKDTYSADFLLMGSANHDIYTAQALANKLIAVAELRKDAVAFISPYRGAFLSDASAGTVVVNSDAEITDKVIEFYSPVTSSSYAVLDSGYKYMYDRFSDTFRYVPLNGDIAGTCARNDINNFPWFSPAGTSRGGILNAVKLAYNPSQIQRDKLYSNRVNPIIFTPGGGITLFGDKTAFAKASAFDRINVRRLFIYLENAISAAARDQMFEFNDEITRTNFVNIVEPFMRDVQAKRGIFDFRVICDETNNTASVIDNNEFVADIFVKPARTINFIGLTFVATRTGVSFEEVIGSV